MLLLATSWSSEYAWATTQIHFWHAMTGHLNDAVDTLAKRFNEKQNAYAVDPLWKGTYPETLTAAIAAYRSKTPPHIVQVFEVGTQTALLSGAIVPVFQLMKDQDLAIDWNNFIRPVLSYYSKDNRLYSMPYNSSTSTLYFRKEAFQKAGLNPDKPPTSWKEVGEYGKRIISAGAAKCGFSTGWPAWILFENMAAWHDLPFATKQNGFGGLDTQLLINGEFQIQLISQLVAWQMENIYSYGGRMGIPDSKFVSGECAMYLESSALIGGFTRSVSSNGGLRSCPMGGDLQKGTSLPSGATLWVMKACNQLTIGASHTS
jgi:sn-glycerol 3-phosphate transport system substrate-binding protein